MEPAINMLCFVWAICWYCCWRCTVQFAAFCANVTTVFKGRFTKSGWRPVQVLRWPPSLWWPIQRTLDSGRTCHGIVTWQCCSGRWFFYQQI